MQKQIVQEEMKCDVCGSKRFLIFPNSEVTYFVCRKCKTIKSILDEEDKKDL